MYSASILLFAALPFLAQAAPQEPGTPKYNCHAACGKGISLAKSASPPALCEGPWKTTYYECLECAGPDGADIWKHYGNALSGPGKACGFPTEPGASEEVEEEAPATTTTTAPTAPATTESPEEEDAETPAETTTTAAPAEESAPVQVGNNTSTVPPVTSENAANGSKVAIFGGLVVAGIAAVAAAL